MVVCFTTGSKRRVRTTGYSVVEYPTVQNSGHCHFADRKWYAHETAVSKPFFVAGVRVVGSSGRGASDRDIVSDKKQKAFDFSLSAGKAHLLSKNPGCLTTAYLDGLFMLSAVSRLKTTGPKLMSVLSELIKPLRLRSLPGKAYS